MKLKQLESLLQDIQAFQEPKILLEQYPTSPHIASRILYTAESTFNDIAGRSIADLGSGCGMLSIGAALMDAASVTGFELDPSAAQVALDNLEGFELETPVDFVLIDITQLFENLPEKKRFDTVIMNPPFGTKKNKGMDMIFLRTALGLASNAVYSLHKTSTRDHIMKKSKEWDVNMEVLAELRYDLPQTYRHHKHKSVDIEVDLIRFSFK
ncbi:rRNA N(6)-adenosine-methyltransferase METTL5 [Lepeophtheirus salmonis]|uniref:Methyltransferase-like protein 5 n=1 Tax=Lepeophtheirus salmonis TaxID=72036 RepID=C1BUH3_LEPSM|nr:rRNA N6-adenosine-methyltransferase METTL5-like [Lepeophtheirus salmonis]ACO12676.1 Methyltransferase-like protein 5 [Lepeophtheirus salmonis]